MQFRIKLYFLQILAGKVTAYISLPLETLLVPNFPIFEDDLTNSVTTYCLLPFPAGAEKHSVCQ